MDPRDDRRVIVRYLYECLENGAFSNLLLKDVQISDFVRASVYGTITYCYAIDFLIRHLGGKSVSDMDPMTRTIIRFGAWQILFSDKVPDYAAVSTSVDLASDMKRGSAGFVNAVLRKIADSTPDERDISNYRPEVAASLKPEIFGVLKKSYGRERAADIGRCFLDDQDVTVRCNLLRTDRETAVSMLEKDGFIVKDGRFMPESLRISPQEGVRIDTADSFVRGCFFVQGEGAMLASHIAAPSKGDMILDCCSAPGGKATHMAELAGDECSITCLDINDSRLELIRENAERLGISSIKCLQADSTDIGAVLPDLRYKFDVVTADVPCSGIGLIGRKPDIRHSLTYDKICSLKEVQADILRSAAGFVRPGGTLIYSTCTLNKDENEEQVKSFLLQNEDFYAEDITGFLPQRLIIDSERCGNAREGHITLFPDKDQCEGFFVMRLRRRS